jgi:hypothetical protein
MKELSRNEKTKFFVILFLLTSLSACIETTHPLCTDENKKDFKGLDSSYVGSLPMVAEDLVLGRMKMKIERVEEGIYRFSDPSSSRKLVSDGDAITYKTCAFGGLHIAETKNAHGTYSSYIMNLSESGLALSYLLIDRGVLNEHSIKYSQVERPLSKLEQRALAAINREENTETYKVFLIENPTDKETQVLKDNWETSFLGFTFRK